MMKSVLVLYKTFDNEWHTVFKNNHGRKIYIKIKLVDKDLSNICECFYIDRPWRPSPLKQKTKYCKTEDLLDVLSAEIDKKFYGIEFVNNKEILTTDKFIDQSLQTKRKHKFLILVDDGSTLRTRLKNRTHRVIYLEIKRNVNKAVVSCCCYYDRRYKRDNALVTPARLNTIYFEYSLVGLLRIVNKELNCDFTDVIVTSDTFGFDKTTLPICGSI